MATSKPLFRGIARIAVLYRPSGTWRFAIYGDGGIVDGRLDEVAVDALDEAQHRVLTVVEQLTGEPYVATWAQSEPGWWTGDLERADEAGTR